MSLLKYERLNSKIGYHNISATEYTPRIAYPCVKERYGAILTPGWAGDVTKAPEGTSAPLWGGG